MQQNNIDFLENEIIETFLNQESVELNNCYISLPKLTTYKATIDDELNLIVRIACLKTSTLFPLLDGKAPILFVDIDDVSKNLQLNLSQINPLLTTKKHMIKALPQQTKALIALKPFKSTNDNKQQQNYTCAYYDDQNSKKKI